MLFDEMLQRVDTGDDFVNLLFVLHSELEVSNASPARGSDLAKRRGFLKTNIMVASHAVMGTRPLARVLQAIASPHTQRIHPSNSRERSPLGHWQ